MRRKLFEHMQKVSFRFFDNRKIGSLMSRITNDLMEIGEMAHYGPGDFTAIMTPIGALVLVSSIYWKLALLIFGAYYVIRGELSYGQFVGFILLSKRGKR